MGHGGESKWHSQVVQNNGREWGPSLMLTPGICRPTAVVPFLLDYELYLLTASNYLALTCAPQSNGYLNCVAGASALTKFGQCESAVYNPLLVATSTSGLSAICAASLAFPVYVDHFEYANLGSVNGGVGTGANGGSTAAPTSAAQGSCSVTLMLYIASSTTYVPEGYQGAAPSVPTPVFGYGCSPVTSTIHISSRSASFQTSSVSFQQQVLGRGD